MPAALAVTVVAMSAARHADVNPLINARNHARVAPRAFAMASSTHTRSAASAKCGTSWVKTCGDWPLPMKNANTATTIAMPATAPADATTASARCTGVGAGRNRAGAGGGVAAGDVMARA